MAAQLNYSYSTPKGVPGGKADISFDEVVTRMNEEKSGVLKFGMAAAVGQSAGSGIRVPVSGDEVEDIEGIVLYHPNTEQDIDGNVVIREGASVGVMTKGHVWGRLCSDAKPDYKAKAYVVVDGDEAGTFTSVSSAVSLYVKCESGDDGAKEVVADATESPTGTQIKLASVTPVEEGYTPAVGDYVLQKQIHGATVDIGATFGKDVDDGIAVIILK